MPYSFSKGCGASNGITNSEFQLSNKIRGLWEQHTVWTRAAIVSLVFDLPDVNYVIKRLLQNPKTLEMADMMIQGININLPK